MKYYLEITLLSSPEVGTNFLWSKVIQQVHLGLVELQDTQGSVPIGVSFPEYLISEKLCTLGTKIRLLANDENILQKADFPKWLFRLKDYVHLTSIRPVPDKINGYSIYKREQPKVNTERLARRYAKRHDGDYEKALTMYNNLNLRIKIPFVRLKSLSNNNVFCLWIKKTSALEPSGSLFSCYGLSSSSTIPEF